MPSRASILRWKDVVMSIVNCVEVVWRLFARYVHRSDCVVVIVDPINVLAGFG